MIIDNVKIYTEAGTFVSGGIITQGDKITEIYTEAEKENIFKKMNMETEHTAAQCSVQDYSARNDIDNVLDGKGAMQFLVLLICIFMAVWEMIFAMGIKKRSAVLQNTR